jgi:hypothetical protein
MPLTLPVLCVLPLTGIDDGNVDLNTEVVNSMQKELRHAVI